MISDNEAWPVADGKTAGRCREASARINDDADGLLTLDAADGELRIVGDHRSYADDDGIDVGAKAMQVIEGRRAVDPA